MRIQRQKETFFWRVARYQDSDWEAHQQHVHRTLKNLYDQGIDSRKFFGEVYRDGNIEHYRPTDADRKMQYDRLLQIMFNTGGPENFERTHGRGLAEITRRRMALLMAGIGGAGKGSILKHPDFGEALRHGGNPFVINPDDTKLVMARLGMVPTARDLQERYNIEAPEGWDELSPMERSPFIHEEASWLTKKITEHLHKNGFDVVHDNTMGKPRKVDELVGQLREHGYDPSNGGRVNTALVDLPMSLGYGRASSRHRGNQERFMDEYGGMEINHILPLVASKYNALGDAGYGVPDEGDSGGRALPPHIHEENNPDPADLAAGYNSRPAAVFPYAQRKTDSSIIFNGDYPYKGTPEVLGGHGDDFRQFIPSERWSGRRMARKIMADGRELTVRLIVKAFKQGEIDFPAMLKAIVKRLHQIKGLPYEKGYYDSHFAHSDEVIFWLEDAVEDGALSDEEYEQAMSVIIPVISGSDSVM